MRSEERGRKGRRSRCHLRFLLTPPLLTPHSHSPPLPKVPRPGIEPGLPRSQHDVMSVSPPGYIDQFQSLESNQGSPASKAGVATSSDSSGKYESEWQDLNLRSPAPEAGGHSRLAHTPSFGSGGEGSEKIGRNTTRTLPVYFSRGRGGAKSKQFGGTLLTPHFPSSESTPTRIRTWNLAFEARDDHPFQHQGIQIQRLASNQQPPRSERGVLPVELLWKKIEAGCHRSDIRPRL